MDNTYGEVNHVTTIKHPKPQQSPSSLSQSQSPSSSSSSSVQQCPPPPKPRKSLDKLKRIKEDNIYVNLKELSSLCEDNQVYDEPVKTYLPPPYPPPPLPPRISSRLIKANHSLDPVNEIDTLEGKHEEIEEETEDEDDDYDDENTQGSEEVYQKITRPIKVAPKLDKPPPLPPRIQRQTSDPSQSDEKNGSNQKLDKIVNNKPAVNTKTPAAAATTTPRASPSPSENRYGMIRSNTLPTRMSGESKAMSLGDLIKSTSAGKVSNIPKKPIRKASEPSATVLRPTEQLKDRTGFLLKTGPTRKTFHQRWCLLTNEKLKYYSDEPGSQDIKDIEPRGSIELSSVLWIGQTLNPPTIASKSSKGKPWKSQSARNKDSEPSGKSLRYFDVAVLNPNGRMFLFASDNHDHVTDWMESLAIRVEPQSRPSLGLYRNFLCCGYIYMKMGISGTWLHCWLVLRARELVIVTDLDTPVSESAIIAIDLRKVMSICYSSPHQISSCSSARETGQPIYLNRNHDTGLYMQGSYKSHTDFLYNHLIKSWTIPVNGTFSDQLLTPSGIPIALEKCLNFICTYGGVRTKGIYSQPGDEAMVKKLMEPLMSNAVVEMHIRPEDGYTVHEVASALKTYLKSFSECLLTELMYPEWWDNNCIKSRDKRLRNLKMMLKRLPTVNFAILKKLICHIYCIIENSGFNEMFLIKLAPIMGPIIYYSSIKPDTSEEATAVAMDVFADLVAGFSWLFDVPPEEMEKEREIEKTLTCLRESKIISAKTGNDILVGVYIHNRDWDQCINVPLSPTMTAQELIDYVHQKGNLKKPTIELSVFEVVSNGQLERFLHFSEIVMSVILSWTTKWPSDDAKNNYLIVKENELIPLLEPYFEQANTRSGTICLSLFSELKFSDIYSGKYFKKHLFEFLGAKLSIYKDAKANKAIGQWNIEDIIWYLGCETKRNPPNPKFSFTFIERSSKIARNKETHYFIGRAVSCNTLEEFHKWIAGMIISQYPSGFKPIKKLIDLLD